MAQLREDAHLRVPPHLDPSATELAVTTTKRAWSATVRGASAASARARGELMRAMSARRLRNSERPRRLCLGAGHAPIAGWLNVDFEPPADVLIDLRYGLPLPHGSVDAIYSEHLIEHLPLDTGIAAFREWRRVLASTGVVRIATPDLALLITDYRGDWRSRHTWVNWPEYSQINSPVQLINVAMREWGHQYLYDYEELSLRLRDAGFSDVRRVSIGESDDPQLRDLETRADSSLVVEARP